MAPRAALRHLADRAGASARWALCIKTEEGMVYMKKLMLIITVAALTLFATAAFAAEMNVTSTPGAPAAIGPYSQAISANGFLFASGQIALSPETGEVVGKNVTEQAEQVCQNIKAVLEANGLTFEDVIKTTCFLADMADFGAFNEVYGKYFTGKPARSCVAVREIPRKLLCEIEIIAVLK